MATDTTRIEAVIDKPAIVITDKKISSAQEFLPVLEQLAQAGKKDVLIIAEDVEGEVLGVLILNKLKGVLNAVAVKAPSFGDRRKDVLEDIAILTGGQVISEDRGDSFENVDMSFFGSARKVLVTKDDTTIIEGAGKPSALKARIAQITAQAADASSDYDRDNFNERRAALQGKVAVIKVGGATETEIEEKKFRVDDAVAATKAALEEGIVPGGGVTLVYLAANTKLKGETSFFTGGAMLHGALDQPFRIIMENAGENPDEWLPKIKTTKAGMGIDITKPGKLVDMKAAGIVDPKRVTREAIQNAVSIAGTAMTMGALIAEVPKAEEPAAGGGGMPGGLNMM
jgi:chaperonin GroEL